MTIIQTNKPLKKRNEHDFYPTPRAFCDEALNLLNLWDFYPLAGAHKEMPRILDPGSGTGVWGDAARKLWRDAFIVGAEIRDIPKPLSYDEMLHGDFLLQNHSINYDLVIGNPPFVYAESFVRVGLDNLSENGMMLYLLPLSFLASKGRAAGLFRHMPPMEVHVAHRVSFTGNGKSDNTEYAVYIWKRGWKGETSLKWMLRSKS